MPTIEHEIDPVQEFRRAKSASLLARSDCVSPRLRIDSRSIIVVGGGNDALTGGHGRDILIGGGYNWYLAFAGDIIIDEHHGHHHTW
jgi:hypothetical protein